MEPVFDTKGFGTTGATARRPLFGLTILLVEDSRYASEVVRLLCLKSGARLRRADCRRAAYRHLATYRPSLVIVDIGLPDGSGLDLVRDLAARGRGGPAVLVTSGDDPASSRAAALRAGADGFIEKPFANLRLFQATVLAQFPRQAVVLPADVVPLRPKVRPEPLAVAEDLHHVRRLMTGATAHEDRETIAYCAQFLRSLGETAAAVGVQDVATMLAAWVDDETASFASLEGVVREISALLEKGFDVA